MYANTGYLNNTTNAIKDISSPLIITSCGYYRVDSGPTVKTERPKGREDYQLLYLLDGNAHFYFNDCERIIKKGEMVLFRPFQSQYYVYYPTEKCQVFWVHFTGGRVEEILLSHNLPVDDNVFYAGCNPDYKRLFEQMIKELQLCRKNYKELLVNSLENIFLLVSRFLVEGEKSGASIVDQIDYAITYFNENYNKEISVSEYAKSVHVSECWFNRVFKKVTKITPLQYIISVRIANAKILLENKGYNVKETAYAVGFNNPLYFSRLFTKHVGVSPTEYKRALINSEK